MIGVCLLGGAGLECCSVQVGCVLRRRDMMQYVVELMEGGDAMGVVAKEILHFAFPVILLRTIFCHGDIRNVRM
jgi:hypothetical protein